MGTATANRFGSVPFEAPGARRGNEWGNADPVLDLPTLRRKLDAAILAEAWEAVKAVRERITELERAAVVNLETERARRGR